MTRGNSPAQDRPGICCALPVVDVIDAFHGFRIFYHREYLLSRMELRTIKWAPRILGTGIHLSLAAAFIKASIKAGPYATSAERLRNISLIFILTGILFFIFTVLRRKFGRIKNRGYQNDMACKEGFDIILCSQLSASTRGILSGMRKKES